MLGWAKKAGGSGPPLPTDGVPWGLIYDVDFTALPPVASFAPGSYVLGGKQWWLKGTTSGQLGPLSSSLGAAGLTLTSTFTSEGTGSNPKLRWFARVKSLTNSYNPLAPLALWARMSATTSDTFSNAICGFCNGAESSAALDAAELLTRTGVASVQGENTQFVYWSPGDSTGSANQSTGVSGENAKYGLELLPGASAYMMSAWSAAATDPYAEPIGVPFASRFRARNLADMANIGVYFACNFNGGSTASFRLMRLQIMQPVVR